VLGVLESIPVADLLEDALRLQLRRDGAPPRQGHPRIRRGPRPSWWNKHKVLQILVNLIRNAKYALDDRGHSDKELTLRLGSNGNQRVKISVIDNGIGIGGGELTRVFEHGFTTRKEGHGFCLHNGALAAKEMGGSLDRAERWPGPGRRVYPRTALRPATKGHDTRLLAKRA